MKIKKSRLLQIIKEEISRIEEVEVVRRGGQDEIELFKDFIEAWKKQKAAEEAGDEEAAFKAKRDSDEKFEELYEIFNTKVGFLNTKGLKTANTDDFKDIFHEKLISNILEEPDLIDITKGRPSTFIAGNVWRNAISEFRRAVQHGGTPSVSGEIDKVSDAAQKKARETFFDLPTGSDFTDPYTAAMIKQQVELALSGVKKYLRAQPKFSENNFTDEEFDQIFDDYLIPYFVNTAGEGGKGTTSGGTVGELAQGIQDYVNNNIKKFKDKEEDEQYILRQGQVSIALNAAKKMAKEKLEKINKLDDDNEDQLEETNYPSEEARRTGKEMLRRQKEKLRELPTSFADPGAKGTLKQKIKFPPTKESLEEIIKEVISEML